MENKIQLVFIMLRQLESLSESIQSDGTENYQGYLSYALSFNKILNSVRENFHDTIINVSIEHLTEYEQIEGNWNYEDYLRLKVDINLLRDTLRALFELNTTPEQRSTIGFI